MQLELGSIEDYGVCALVDSSDHSRTYRVSVMYDKDSQSLFESCNCKAHRYRGYRCRHLQATIRAWKGELDARKDL
jgi:hypothetical protein